MADIWCNTNCFSLLPAYLAYTCVYFWTYLQDIHSFAYTFTLWITVTFELNLYLWWHSSHVICVMYIRSCVGYDCSICFAAWVPTVRAQSVVTTNLQLFWGHVCKCALKPLSLDVKHHVIQWFIPHLPLVGLFRATVSRRPYISYDNGQSKRRRHQMSAISNTENKQ